MIQILSELMLSNFLFSFNNWFKTLVRLQPIAIEWPRYFRFATRQMFYLTDRLSALYRHLLTTDALARIFMMLILCIFSLHRYFLRSSLFLYFCFSRIIIRNEGGIRNCLYVIVLPPVYSSEYDWLKVTTRRPWIFDMGK